MHGSNIHSHDQQRGTSYGPESDEVPVLAPIGFESYYGSGNWKDVRGIGLLLTALSRRPRLHSFDPRHPDSIDEVIGPSTTDILFYSSWWPSLLRRVRARAPRIRLHVRTANAEALQHWHRSRVSFTRIRESARVAYGFLRTAARDVECRRRADTLLGISEWDNRHYWRLLPGRASVVDVPYFSPWPELRADARPRPWESRARVIVSMPGASDAIGSAAQRNFERLADAFVAAGRAGSWQFVVSPAWNEPDRPEPAAPVEVHAGPFDPWDALCAARAVAVLTPLGFGAKTTVFDALAAGCHVLVEAGLVHRIPRGLRARCIVVRRGDAIDVPAIEERLATAPDYSDLHAGIRSRALEGLRSVFG